MKVSELEGMIKSGHRPGGMTYSQYSNLLKSANRKPVSRAAFEKAEQMDEEPDEDDEEDEDEDDDDTEKSVRVGADALRKSISAYSAVSTSVRAHSTGADRMAYLQDRLDSGVITKSERQELATRIAADDDDGGDLRKSLSDRIDEDGSDSGRIVKANGFLKSLVDGIDGSLESMSEQVSRDSAATRQLLHGQGELIKSLAGLALRQSDMLEEMHARLQAVESTPVRPRSVQTRVAARQMPPRPLAKSVQGDNEIGGEETLSKAQVVAGLQALTKAAMERGDNATVDRLIGVTAKYESTRQIAPQHYAAAAAAFNGSV